eukprot:TRINITY_DN548_c0_g2_i1.p1 TRINITY_DN548_c0_g2~~TRINITY_DN548_c0_g2_i1.p1  ORF type:complete len:218 (-),score=51.05 TRINITY_DN548_c0_g2_i1:158-811(-)
MVQRQTYRRRHSYNTLSNKVKKVKTPGNKIVFHYRKKIANGPSCGDCGARILGIPRLRPIEYSRISKNRKTVSRAYGGSRCATCTKNRIIRAFLIEEQKIVKHVLKRQKESKKVKVVAAPSAAPAAPKKAATTAPPPGSIKEKTKEKPKKDTKGGKGGPAKTEKGGAKSEKGGQAKSEKSKSTSGKGGAPAPKPGATKASAGASKKTETKPKGGAKK